MKEMFMKMVIGLITLLKRNKQTIIRKVIISFLTANVLIYFPFLLFGESYADVFYHHIYPFPVYIDKFALTCLISSSLIALVAAMILTPVSWSLYHLWKKIMSRLSRKKCWNTGMMPETSEKIPSKEDLSNRHKVIQRKFPVLKIFIILFLAVDVLLLLPFLLIGKFYGSVLYHLTYPFNELSEEIAYSPWVKKITPWIVMTIFTTIALLIFITIVCEIWTAVRKKRTEKLKNG